MRLLPILSLVMFAACASQSESTPPSTAPDTGGGSATGSGGSGSAGSGSAGSGSGSAAPTCDNAGTLIVYAIPPPVSLDWSSPSKLLATTVESAAASKLTDLEGKTVLGHEIGHVNFELDCGADSIPLTGQTGGGEDWSALTDGAGLLLADTPGQLNNMSDGDPSDTAADIAARQKSGLLSRVAFTVNAATCHRIKTFFDAYVASGAYTHYDGAFRPRRFQGAGCAIFGAGVIDVAGLLRRSVFTPVWARSEMIGSARIANFLGQSSYPYGSELSAITSDGTHYVWPQGQDIPVSTTDPTLATSSTLHAWNGPQDTAWGIAGLTGPMATQVPFSIYDPQLMAEWAESVWTQATANGGTATSLEATWTAGTVEHVHQITYDATCVQPQTIAFDADNDDLYKDSDEPN